MEIISAAKKDFKIFLPIKQEFNKGYGISEKKESFILKEFENYLNKGIIALAVIDKRIVGYLSGLIEEDLYEKYGHIAEIFVSEHFRGKGISTKLKDKFLDFIRTKRTNLCRIYVNPSNPAQEAYKKWGFKIDKYRMSLRF